MFETNARVFEVFLIVLDGVQGETLWGGESRARDHTHKQEQKAVSQTNHRCNLNI